MISIEICFYQMLFLWNFIFLKVYFNFEQDIWLVIRGNVYDVTKFLDEHPGGDEVLNDLAGNKKTRFTFEICLYILF